MPDDLGEYRGRPIRKMAVEVRNTSGGLNAAMRVNSEVIEPGETRFVCYEVVFDKFRFDPMDEGDAWCLVPIGHAETAAFLDETVVREAIAASKEAQAMIDGEKKGLAPMEPVDRIEEHQRHDFPHAAAPVKDCLLCQHDTGAHKRKRKGCPACNPEVEPEVDDLAPRRGRKGAR